MHGISKFLEVHHNIIGMVGVDHTLHLTTAVNSFLKLKESMIIHGKAYRTQHTADYIILYYIVL